MPRFARSRSDTGIYHLMLRGINRQNIFEDEEDREKLFETLARYKIKSGYDIYGYCFMSNHFHLLLKEKTEPISLVVKRISSSYVYWYNWKYERCGHLFQERFKSEAVDSNAYLLTVLRYIHQNPAKAGLISYTRLSDFKWSSYREYVSKPLITDTDLVLSIFSDNRRKALALFKEYNSAVNDDQCLEDREKIRVSDDEVKAILRRYGVKNINQLLRLDKAKRDKIISDLKSVNGVTLRQLARITGISKSIIDRI
jgi:putative transposase